MMGFLKEVLREFTQDDCPRLAAALSYYTVFALPPVLIIVLLLTGTVADPSSLEARVADEVRQLVGPEAARQVRTIMAEARGPGRGGLLPTMLGIAALLFGATGAFVQLQAALNIVWEVRPDPERGGVRSFLAKRLMSFGMVLGMAFLLLVSLVLSAFLSAFGDRLGQWLGTDLSSASLRALELGVSFAVFSLLFGAIFRILPDATIRWRAVAAGAVVTAALFLVAHFAIGFYLGRSDPGSAYGAAGSLAVVLVWVYLSSMILLLGAEFTQVWARRRGEPIRPEPGAVRVEIEMRRPIEEPAAHADERGLARPDVV